MHRLLAAAIGIAPLPDDLRDQELLHDCSGVHVGGAAIWGLGQGWVGGVGVLGYYRRTMSLVRPSAPRSTPPLPSHTHPLCPEQTVPPLLCPCDCVCVCVDNLNTRHRNAQQAGRSSIELYTLIYFYGKEVVADARVLQVGCLS